MPKFNFTLFFTGNCEEAFNYYKSIFGGEYIAFVRYNDPSMKGTDIPTGYEDKIAIAALQIDNDILLGTDNIHLTKDGLVQGNNIVVTVHPDNKEEADRIFTALSAEGKIKMPIAFHKSDAYMGDVTDKFGIEWKVWFAKRGPEPTQQEKLKYREIITNRDMSRTLFHSVDLNNTVFDSVNLGGVSIRDANMKNMTIDDAFLDGLTINGIRMDRFLDLIESEAGQLDPDRLRFRMRDIYDPAELIRVMSNNDKARAEFYSFLRSTPFKQITANPPGLNRWSALEHIRHLLFAEDIYLNHLILDNNKPLSKLGVSTFYQITDQSNSASGNEQKYDLETVLAAWDAIHAEMKDFLKDINPDVLKREVKDDEKKTVGNTLQIMFLHDFDHIRMAKAAVEDVS